MSATPHQRGNTPALMVTIPKPTMPTLAASTPKMSNTMSTAAAMTIATLAKATMEASVPHLP